MDASNTPLVISDSRKEIKILATVGTDNIKITDITTSSEDVNLSGLKVYPVPAGDHLIIEIPAGLFQGNSIRLSIPDISGRYIFINNKLDLTGSPVVIDISHLKGWIYLLEAADKIISRKIKIVKTQ